jgi:hypothetical protein
MDSKLFKYLQKIVLEGEEVEKKRKNSKLSKIIRTNKRSS